MSRPSVERAQRNVFHLPECECECEKTRRRLTIPATVPEYWVVNLLDRVVEVHREPAAGGYRQITTVPNGARLQLLAFPDVELAVDDFLR